ncbi:MAG: amylo-alpha-1,6-glucosidase [Stellaceae bacterium]
MISRKPPPRPPVLKAGDAFGIFDTVGNVPAAGSAGVFLDDSRHLSRLELRVAGRAPLLLSSAVTAAHDRLDADLTNAAGIGHTVPRNALYIRNGLVLGEGALFQTVAITSYATAPCRVRLELLFAADFVDVFELRGLKRARRGDLLPARVVPDGVTLAYRGLDAVTRRTELTFEPPPNRIEPNRASWELAIDPGGRLVLEIESRFARSDQDPMPQSREATLAAAARRRRERDDRAAEISTTNETCNEWLARSRADLAMLTTETADGPYPYAGVPWFVTAFGRDGLVTALECMWLDPGIAAGVLRFLAARQATTVDPASDAEPGKILHETRKGEMAALKEVPFGHYYGSVDATPLFIVLADAYATRTGDLALIRGIWPNIRAAVAWLRDYGDADGDGFIEYGRHTATGLRNQGWKDSGDAIFHRDGRLAMAPIALVEVQAYAYAAWCGAARLARRLGYDQEHTDYAAAASRLKARFEAAFWSEALGNYVLALDRDKRACDVRTSNAGHVLFGGLATEAHAARVAAALMRPEFFSGWGIRTLAEGQRRYNPMSYHNGSIWPHDNAMIAMGLADYGIKAPVLAMMDGLFAAAAAMPLRRLPELFCGFPQEAGMGPVTYPTACSPQAWSSATGFAMIGALLGISLDATARQVRIHAPVLPPWLPTVRIGNLRLGDAVIDLRFERHDHGVAVEIRSRHGDVELIETGERMAAMPVSGEATR